MKLTTKQLLAQGYVKNPNGSWSKPSLLSRPAVPARVSHPKPQPDAGGALERANQNERTGQGRLGLRITGRRVELLDPDNFAGGCKYLIDQLRYAGLIPEDNPGAIELTTRQVRVTLPEEEGTEVEIYELPE